MNKTRTLAAAMAVLAAGAAIGWGLARWQSPGAETKPTAPAEERKPLYWYDPMVPTQKFDKPGPSPFMDMALVPKYADEATDQADPGGISVSPAAQQSLGLRVATVEKMGLGEDISAAGSLQLNERDISIVQARAAGFVERVYARAPGDVIAAGAPLVDLLLPDWVAAQREFLAVSALGDAALTAAARQRLTLLGMPESLIARVATSGQASGRYTVSAPAGGLLAELMVRQGMSVAPGLSLARINDLATLWLEVAVPEAQGAALAPGQAADARFAAFPGEAFHAKVAAVLPEVNRDTRTLRLRIELPNPGLRLKAGMFAEVSLRGLQREAIVLPSEAVIRTGKRALAYVVDAPGRYRPVELELGAEIGARLVVLRGLEAGQQVVASAQFLIDSETSLQGVLPAAADFKSTGTIVEISGDALTLSHAPVPALRWPAMTMAFKLADPQLKAGLAKQQAVRFSFVQRGDDHVLTAIAPITAGEQP